MLKCIQTTPSKKPNFAQNVFATFFTPSQWKFWPESRSQKNVVLLIVATFHFASIYLSVLPLLPLLPLQRLAE